MTRPPSYRRQQEGYTFVLDRTNVDRLKGMPEFEGREEPAVAEDFLRFRVEAWAENLADAGAGPGQIGVRIDPHQRKAHLEREASLLFSADI
ncbi:MAG TPA: hypothetical protein VKE50_10300 [Thermoanaerobaculia bacterium]|nr:hypothetical protein [Thermoanaerobaculia bacterium]